MALFEDYDPGEIIQIYYQQLQTTKSTTVDSTGQDDQVCKTGEELWEKSAKSTISHV